MASALRWDRFTLTRLTKVLYIALAVWLRIRDSRNTQSFELNFRALLIEGSAKVLFHRDASDLIGGVWV
jgi:hypothetical protein